MSEAIYRRKRKFIVRRSGYTCAHAAFSLEDQFEYKLISARFLYSNIIDNKGKVHHGENK